MTYKRKITGVQQSGSKQKQNKSDEEYSDSVERESSRGTSRGKRRGAKGARGTVNCEEVNVSQKLLLKDVEKKVKMKVKMKKKKFCSLLPNKKPYKPNKPHIFNKPNNAKRPNKPNKPHLFNKPNKAKRPNKPNNCLPKPIHYNNFNNFNFNKASKPNNRFW